MELPYGDSCSAFYGENVATGTIAYGDVSLWGRDSLCICLLVYVAVFAAGPIQNGVAGL